MSNQPIRTHHLKTWPYSFESVRAGTKRAEYRKLWDRDFAVGDAIILKEYRPEEQTYTGREIGPLIITEITTGYGIPEGYGMLSFIPQGRKVEPVSLSGDDPGMIGGSSHGDRFVIFWSGGAGYYLAKDAGEGGLRHWTANPKYAETFTYWEAEGVIAHGEVIDENGNLHAIKGLRALIRPAEGQ